MSGPYEAYPRIIAICNLDERYAAFDSYKGDTLNESASVLQTYQSRSAESFKRAKRKAHQHGYRLLSYHFTGDKFVSQWGR